jgi:hypothetical protein
MGEYRMYKTKLALATGLMLSAISFATFAATKISVGHYGAPRTTTSSFVTGITGAVADNFDVVNHDPSNTYQVEVNSWSGTLYANPNPDQPDPPSCIYCQHSNHIYAWPTTITVNGYSYSVAQHGPITYFDIYPSNKLTQSEGVRSSTTLKPRIVIH